MKAGETIIDISMKKLDSAISEVNKMTKDMQKSIDRTANDCKKHAASAISKAVNKVYNIKTTDVKNAYTGAQVGKKTIGQIKLNVNVTSLRLVYKGRSLSPRRFNMSPKTLEVARKRKKLTIRLTVYKGQRKVLHGKPEYQKPVFLTPTPQGIVLPFQRKYENKRYPIYAVHSTSIPQMIDNESVNTDIKADLEDFYLKRLEHNVDHLTNKT